MIGRNLRILMAERSESIQDVHEATLLSRTTISVLVNGTGSGIQFKTLVSLCKHFNIEVAELFKDVAL